MIKVLKSGFYTTIQDAGRYGFREYGVPYSGVMDRYAAGFANTIVGNSPDMAVIEITMTAPLLKFTKPAIIGISGADFKPFVNGQSETINAPIAIPSGAELRLDRPSTGVRAYIAVKGGLSTEKWLGSQSMYHSVSETAYIRNGDTIPFSEAAFKESLSHSRLRFNRAYLESNILKVTKGPEYDFLSEDTRTKLETIAFKVSALNNRMAYQLEPILHHQSVAILTAPVLPGTVQLTPNGQLIVLMRDGQTTGGYPRVLQLDESSINCLSQKRMGNTVVFQLER